MKKTPVKKVPNTKAITVVMSLAMLLALAALLFGCASRTTGGLGENTGTNGSSPKAPSNDPYAVAFAWETTADCSVCHKKEHDSFANSTTSVGFHATQGLACSTCHADPSALPTVHKGVTSSSKTPKRLRSTKVEQATCLNCHKSLSGLAQNTAGSNVLTDSKGKVVNPHALPQNSDHAIISCVSCHEMHTDNAMEKTAKDFCVSCHHENVFECNTCHKI